MKYTLFLAIAALLFLSATLFSSISPQVKTEEGTLYQSGEEALRKGNWIEAEQHYKNLWENLLKQKATQGTSKASFQDNLLRDVGIKYIAILNKLERQEKVSTVIQQLMELFSPATIAEAYFEKAKILCSGNKSQEAFILLDNYLGSLPFKEWPSKMQSFYQALEFSLNEYYKRRLKEAESQLRMGQSEEAENTLNEVAEAVKNGSYPSMKSPMR